MIVLIFVVNAGKQRELTGRELWGERERKMNIHYIQLDLLMQTDSVE